MYKLYLDGDLNDVTQEYIYTILEALRENSFECECVGNNLSKIDSDDIVIVIDVVAFKHVFRNNKKQRIITWAQGVFPEETDMTYPKNSLKQILRKRYWKYHEKRMILKSEYLFFVSQAQANHYKKCYRFNTMNYFVMPCFNMGIDKESFFYPNKYDSPSFLYAGGLNGWQCVEEALKVFVKVKQQLPAATFTLLTRQVDDAKKLAKRCGVSDIDIRSVPLDQMNIEQQKFKYGFLLREDVIVNQVATPTKLNSYMASGVIPIITDVVESFKENLVGLDYIITAQNVNNLDAIAKQIIEFENKSIISDNILKEYIQLFDRYYNKSMYISKFKNLLPRP